MKPDPKKPVKQSPPVKSTRLGEEQEPAAAGSEIPIWLFVALAVLGFFGAMRVSDLSGGFNNGVYLPYLSAKQVEDVLPKGGSAAIAAKGKEIYSRTCMPCHQASGMGAAGQFPPLAGSEWVLAKGPDRIIRIVLNGLQGPIKVKDAEYNQVMVPWRDTLKDDEIAAILTYVRSEWGNKAPEVKPEQVKAVRDDTKDKSDAWNVDDLLKVPDAGQ